MSSAYAAVHQRGFQRSIRCTCRNLHTPYIDHNPSATSLVQFCPERICRSSLSEVACISSSTSVAAFPTGISIPPIILIMTSLSMNHLPKRLRQLQLVRSTGCLIGNQDDMEDLVAGGSEGDHSPQSLQHYGCEHVTVSWFWFPSIFHTSGRGWPASIEKCTSVWHHALLIIS